MTNQRMTKSNDFILSGVCSGVAEYKGWSPGAVRALFLIMTLLTGLLPGIVLYTILGVTMPPPVSNGLDIEKVQRKIELRKKQGSK